MRLLAACLVLFTLAACGEDVPVYSHSVYTLPSTPGGRLCTAQCDDARDYCGQACGLDYRACYNDMESKAIKAYDDYARDRFNSRMTVDMRPGDFEHPESCDKGKTSCLADCERPYKACYTSCGGGVSTETSCRYFCFE